MPAHPLGDDPGQSGASPGPDSPAPPLTVFQGRSREIEQLSHQIIRSRSAQRPFLWITGESGCGKTAFIERGLIPRLAKQLGTAFTWTRLVPRPSEPVLDFVLRLVESLIAAPGSTAGQPASPASGTTTRARLNQFLLLLEEDPAEACEYVEAHLRQSLPRHQGEHRHLIFIDGMDRLCPGGLVAPPEDDDWYQESLAPLAQFLQQLTWSTVFLMVTTLRQPNVPPFRQTIASQLRLPGTWISLEPMPASRPVSKATAWIFLEPPAKVQAAVSTLPETPPSRWADAAEAACGAWLAEGRDDALDRLFRLLGEDSWATASYRTLARRSPETRKLADHFIERQVLHLSGAQPEEAAISWSLPAGLGSWDRYQRWKEGQLALHRELEKLDAKRREWVANEESPVLLLHATKYLDRAVQLLDLHDWQPFLSGPLEAYLRESLAMRERLRD